MKKGTVQAWLLPAALVYIALFTVASFADLAINQALYNPEDTMSIIMECFGWYPVFAPAILLLLIVGTLPKEEFDRPWVRYVALLIAVGGCGLIFRDSYKHWHARGMVESFWSWQSLLLFGILAVLVVVCGVLVSRTEAFTRLRLLFVSVWGTLFLLVNQVVINLLKQVWQRTRFDDMVAPAADFSSFTPWWQPFGNGGTSFPSGHTANAASILLLVLLCDLFPAWHKKRKLVYAMCWAYIVLMALCRIVIGRHYLSDTLAGSAIMAGFLYLLRHNRYYKRGVRKMQKALRTQR